MNDSCEKREFMAVYDYGMGGVWALIAARRKAEIEVRYPILKVLEERPDWMTQARFDDMCFWRFDIDEPPPDWLRPSD